MARQLQVWVIEFRLRRRMDRLLRIFRAEKLRRETEQRRAFLRAARDAGVA